MESHGKALYFWEMKSGKKIKKYLKKTTDESATAFNFSRNRHKHTFFALSC